MAATDNIGSPQNRGEEFKTGTLAATAERYMSLFVEATKRNLDRDGSNASRSLWQSIRFNTKIFGLDYSFQLIMEDHYEYVDKGRRPGKMPPINSLKKWIVQKSLISRTQSRAAGSSIDKKVTSLAYLMARKIGKKGTKGTNFYSKVVNPNTINKLKTEISQALKKDVQVEITEIRKNIQNN